jgi:TolA-binding protein
MIRQRSLRSLLFLLAAPLAFASGTKVAPPLASEPPAPIAPETATGSTPVAKAEKIATAEAAPAPIAAPAGPEAIEAAPENPPATPARAKTPKDAFAGFLNLGLSLTDRGDYEAAEIAYRQVLKTPRAPLPATKSALLGLARMHRKQGAHTKAAAIYEKFLKEFPDDDRAPDALLDLGRTLRNMGAYRSAIARFYSVINSTLKLPAEGFERYQLLAKTAQFEIAETHYETGDFAEASKFFLRLRQLDLAPSDRARAHFKAGYALHLGGDFDRSVTTLRAYLDQCPNDENVPEARYLLAINLRRLKRSQDALAATLDLLATEKSRMNADPKRWVYWQRRTGNQLANDFFENGDTTNAQAIYSSLLLLAPEPAWRLPITYQIGLCYERLGATEQAGKSYRSIIDAAGQTPAPELTDLVQMAVWRLEHIGWRDGMQQQLTTFFETTTGRTPAPPPAPKKTASVP